jgi:hypothetical protein
LQITLKQHLLLHAPGLTPKAVLEKLAEIKMIEVWIAKFQDGWVALAVQESRHRQPSKRGVGDSLTAPASIPPTDCHNRVKLSKAHPENSRGIA